MQSYSTIIVRYYEKKNIYTILLVKYSLFKHCKIFTKYYHSQMLCGLYKQIILFLTDVKNTQIDTIYL